MDTKTKLNTDSFSMDEFGKWANLYKSDPVLFMQKRQELLDKAHARVSPRNQERLAVIQHSLNHITDTRSSYSGAALMFERMKDILISGRDELHRHLARELDTRPSTVVNFRSKRN